MFDEQARDRQSGRIQTERLSPTNVRNRGASDPPLFKGNSAPEENSQFGRDSIDIEVVADNAMQHTVRQ